MQTQTNERLLTPMEVAETLSISRWTVYQWISDHHLRSVKLGRLVRVPSSEVERIIQENTQEL